jgi:hypothetical protein
MMWHEFIKIKGMDSDPDQDPGVFEIFQGLGAEFIEQNTADDTGLLPITPATPFPEALWTGQNRIISAESTYALNLETLFKQQQQAMPKDDGSLMSEVMNEIGSAIEGAVSVIFGEFVSGYVAAASGGFIPALPVKIIADYAAQIGISYCWDKLKLLFVKGVELCQAVKAENDAMLSLEVSLENYTLRKQNLQLHTEMLENVITQVATMEEMLDRNIQKSTDMKGVVKALKPAENLKELKGINEDTDYLKDMKDAIESIQEEHEKLRKAVQDLTFVDATVQIGDDLKARMTGKALEF